MSTSTSTRARPSAAALDAVTMLRRNLLRAVRYPGLTLFVVGGPVVVLLLVTSVFGGTLGAGLPAATTGAAPGSPTQRYLAYLVPGLLVMAVAGTASGASISVAQDMTEGIVARFRSMAISRGAVLSGHVLGNAVQGLLTLAVLAGVALLMGWRPAAGPGDWLLLTGFLAVLCVAMSWLAVAMGMSAGSVETASNTPMLLVLLPSLGSGFVPTSSMPGWLQGFAAWQPFTPVIETVRALLASSSPGAQGWVALGWCALAVAVGSSWATSRYERRSVR